MFIINYLFIEKQLNACKQVCVRQVLDGTHFELIRRELPFACSIRGLTKDFEIRTNAAPQSNSHSAIFANMISS